MGRIRILALLVLAAVAAQLPGDDVDPATALWRAVKQGLTGDHAAAYWQDSVKQALLPGRINRAEKSFTATVISSEPAEHPTSIVVAISDEKTPEATLRINGPLRNSIAAGSTVRFRGVATAFSPHPFMLTFEAELGDVRRTR